MKPSIGQTRNNIWLKIWPLWDLMSYQLLELMNLQATVRRRKMGASKVSKGSEWTRNIANLCSPHFLWFFWTICLLGAKLDFFKFIGLWPCKFLWKFIGFLLSGWSSSQTLLLFALTNSFEGKGNLGTKSLTFTETVRL